MFLIAFKKFEIPITSLSHAKLYDGSGTEVDADVFEEVIKEPDLGIFKLALYNEGTGVCFLKSWLPVAIHIVWLNGWFSSHCL